MKELEDRILIDGEAFPGGILKVGNFLNQQIDVGLLMRMGEDTAKHYKNSGITKVLTIEASGIAFAVAAAYHLGVQATFAKKNQSINISGEVYSTKVESFTHKKTYDVVISKEYIQKDDKILIADDFLANGNAVNGLIDLCRQAGAEVVGITAEIEKGFQGGGDALRQAGYDVYSLAVIDGMDGKNIRFREN